MNPKLTSPEGKDTSSFLLYLVLAARHRFELPHLLFNPPWDFTHRGEPENSDHMVGKTFLYGSRDPVPLFVPQRNRALRVFSVVPDTEASRVPSYAIAMTAGTVSQVRPPQGLVLATQTMPFLAHYLHVSQFPIYPYGVWSAGVELFVLTDIENFDLMVNQTSPGQGDWHSLRMRSITDGSVNLSIQRIIPRWNRWTRESAILVSPAARFQALERYIL